MMIFLVHETSFIWNRKGWASDKLAETQRKRVCVWWSVARKGLRRGS